MTVISIPEPRRARKGSSGKLWKSVAVAMFALLAFSAWFLQSGASAVLTKSPVGSTLAGQASIIDADTLEIHGERIRLEGVDAPESGQRCYSATRELYRCGAGAANALDRWINKATVSCQVDGTDRYNRLLATCSARGKDIQSWLVENGYALAYRQYSTAYVEAEHRAAASRAGIWEGEFVNPWDWRQGLRMPGEKPTKAMREGKFADRGA